VSAGGRAKPQRHQPGDPGWVSKDILKLAEVATAEAQYDPDDGERGPYFCRRCTSVFTVDRSELEPSPFCNLCAHDAAAQLGAELLLVTTAIDKMAPPIAAGVRAWIETLRTQRHADAFVEGVLGLATDKVLGRSRGRRRK
jgi:hypothetical protein